MRFAFRRRLTKGNMIHRKVTAREGGSDNSLELGKELLSDGV